MTEEEFEKNLSALTLPAAPDRLRRRLRAQAAEAETKRAPRRLPGRRLFLGALALCLLSVGVGVRLHRQGATGPGVAHAAEAVGGALTLRDRLGKAIGTCPLTHTKVHAQISGFVAQVTVTQRFVGPAQGGPVEALYTFPLPEGAAVNQLTMRIGKTRLVRGVLQRRAQARATYEAAKAQGKTAALLDQQRPNVFTQSLANLMPGETVEVQIRYVAPLKYQDGAAEFVFPMVVAQRYGPDALASPLAPSRSGHDIALTVDLEAGLPLQKLLSALHGVHIERLSPSHARIELLPGDRIPNKDFLLRYAVAGQELQEGLLAHADGKTGEFMLLLQPPAAPPPSDIAPKELVFVVDQTGSQAGEPIAKSQATLRHCLANLHPQDTFQVIGFNTDVMPCFDQPRAATPDNIRIAQRFIDGLNADGGTDILKSIQYALRQPDTQDGRLRIISYMTDGLVDNESQILATISKERGRVRLFPFGVGNSTNHFLLESMAREGRGVCQLVPLTADSQKVAEQFQRRIADPLLTDISVDWGALAVEEVYPRHIPDVFAAEPIVLKGRYTKAGTGPITLHGTLRGKPWARTLTVSLPQRTQSGEEIRALWARARLEELRQQRYLSQLDGATELASRLEKEMTATALQYNLMSEFTSFVAVEERVVNAKQKSRSVVVQGHQPEGTSVDAQAATSGVVSTPEPTTLLLLPLGALLLLRRRR